MPSLLKRYEDKIAGVLSCFDRVVVYVRTATTSKKVLDVAGDAFHAAIGHFEGNELVAHHSSGGDPETLEMLAEIVADNPRGEASGR